MPPKKKRSSDNASSCPVTKKPKKDAPAKRGPKLPPPLPVGDRLTDYTKVQWQIGGSVGQGGFGQIYLASECNAKKSSAVQYVIKVEPYDNGPLFSELSFYRRIAKPVFIEAYTKSSKVNYLPIPKFIGAGEHERGSIKYRFMVMERFGEDIEKLFCKANRKFNLKTVCYLGLRMIEALEYLHDNEYVHADIKGSNILTGYLPSDIHKVYLVDYGLAYRYIKDGVHHEYKPDPKRCHDGTIEFTSIDAHDGANPSRRGDMEILGYCMIQWASGTLPWMDYLNNKPKVASEKKKYKSNVSGLLKVCFKDGSGIQSCLKQYMESVYSCEYNETPDYAGLKGFLKTALDQNSFKDNKSGLEWITTGKSKDKKVKSVVSSPSPPQRRSQRIASSHSPYSPVKRPFSDSIDEEGMSSGKAKRPKLSSNDQQILRKISPKKKALGKKKTLPKRKLSPKKVSQTAAKGKAKTSVAKNSDGDSQVPVVYYPTCLGYDKENGDIETFGSLAARKKKQK